MAGSRQRLKMKDLVVEVFTYLSKRYDHCDEESIVDMVTPLEEIRRYLNDKYEIAYTSNQHIYNQLRSYEEELGVPLFRKVRSEGTQDNFCIALETSFEGFKHKKLLYLTQKIKIANAVYERIRHDQGDYPQKQSLKVMLGAGTEIYYVAKALASGTEHDDLSLEIYTHNLGVIDFFLNDIPKLENIRLFTRHSRIDTLNNIFITQGEDFYKSVEFDYVIQAANNIYDGELFVASEEEGRQKRDILADIRGTKILVLTMHEFTADSTENLTPYGTLNQYDYLIIPNSRTMSDVRKEQSLLFGQYLGKILEPEITHYNYKVFCILK